MKIITIAQNKGGVGKTTLAGLLLEYYARRGFRTAGIDLDQQCNLSQRFRVVEQDTLAGGGWIPKIHVTWSEEYEDWDGRSSIADIWFGKPPLPYETDIPNLDIFPAHGRNMELIDEQAEGGNRKQLKERIQNQLRVYLDDPTVREEYDIVVIDTPPAMGALVRASLRAADDVVIPTLLEPKSVKGLSTMIGHCFFENRYRPSLINIIGIQAMMMRNNTLHKTTLKQLHKSTEVGQYMMPHAIGTRIAFAETDLEDASPTSVFDLPASDLARVDAETFCGEVSRRAGIAERRAAA